MPMGRRIDAFEEQVRTVSNMNIGAMWDRMMGEFLGAYDRLSRQQLSEAELERELQSFLDGLSPKPTEDIARKSTGVAYNQGRDAALTTAKAAGVVRFVVRSEVLDTNTCRPCQLLDGEVFDVGDPEYYANMPPAQCDGGDRCRGFYIPVAA